MSIETVENIALGDFLCGKVACDQVNVCFFQGDVDLCFTYE